MPRLRQASAEGGPDGQRTVSALGSARRWRSGLPKRAADRGKVVADPTLRCGSTTGAVECGFRPRDGIVDACLRCAFPWLDLVSSPHRERRGLGAAHPFAHSPRLARNGELAGVGNRPMPLDTPQGRWDAGQPGLPTPTWEPRGFTYSEPRHRAPVCRHNAGTAVPTEPNMLANARRHEFRGMIAITSHVRTKQGVDQGWSIIALHELIQRSVLARHRGLDSLGKG